MSTAKACQALPKCQAQHCYFSHPALQKSSQPCVGWEWMRPFYEGENWGLECEATCPESRGRHGAQASKLQSFLLIAGLRRGCLGCALTILQPSIWEYHVPTYITWKRLPGLPGLRDRVASWSLPLPCFLPFPKWRHEEFVPTPWVFGVCCTDEKNEAQGVPALSPVRAALALWNQTS